MRRASLEFQAGSRATRFPRRHLIFSTRGIHLFSAARPRKYLLLVIRSCSSARDFLFSIYGFGIYEQKQNFTNKFILLLIVFLKTFEIL